MAAASIVQCVSCKQTTFPAINAFKMMALLTVAICVLGSTSHLTFHEQGVWSACFQSLILATRFASVTLLHSRSQVQDLGGVVPWATLQRACQERMLGVWLVYLAIASRRTRRAKSHLLSRLLGK